MAKKKSNSNKHRDPHYRRELKKYDSPVPSREYVLSLLKQLGRPVSVPRLYDELGLKSAEDREAMRRRVKAMLRDGQLLQDRKGRLCLLSKVNLKSGRVIIHPSGYGFVELDEGGDDLFLSAAEARAVMHNDRVLVSAQFRRATGKREAVIAEVLTHAVSKTVGRFFFDHGVSYVESENKRILHTILVPQDKTKGAKPGELVEISLIKQPSKRSQPMGEVIEVLGQHMAPGMEIEVALRSYDIPHVWPEGVDRALDQVSTEVTDADCDGKKDLTHLPFVTIDPKDAKDFDDAIHCEKTKSGYRLMVAIAHVSHYVKKDTPIDVEAVARGTSVYFPGRVVPMLPEILSNGICSLKPNVRRLSLVCDMHLDDDGKVKRFQFLEAVIESKKRFIYGQVADLLEDSKAIECADDVYQTILNMKSLYDALIRQRAKRGALDFDFPEYVIEFDDHQKISMLTPKVRGVAHKMVEEAMLLANVCAAKFIEKSGMPSLYRNHEPPSEEKLEELVLYLSELGVPVKNKMKQAKHINAIVELISDRPDFHLIQMVMLQSMRQAMYGVENQGHFGLAYKAYTHYTSPIRRYPDLLVHRLIVHLIDKQEPKAPYHYQLEEMTNLGLSCSKAERRADEATRDVESWLKCEYMLEHVGSEFDGVVVSVTNFGLFVEISSLYIEGLVHITQLADDYYHYNAKKHMLVGEHTHRSYGLGDKLRVLVSQVDLDKREIDFSLVSDNGS